MSKTKPIPRKLLIHEITYRKKGEDDGWGESTDDEFEIKRVRVDSVTSIERSNNREDIEAQHIVFIDYKNSSKFVDDAAKDDQIYWRGKWWNVTRVEYQYAFGPDPHHLEVEIT